MSQYPSNHRTVLITGCSKNGIGAALAFKYHKHGYYVFATARNPSKTPEDLVSLPNVTTISLDVTSQTSIDQAVKKVSEISDGKLDVLINNSGVAISAAVLDTDIPQAKQMFDVNVFGVLAVTKAFMPLLIKSRNGLVANISSINGETNMPFGGVYGASKSAATTMSETLRLEVAPLGVRVATVITGIIETELHANEPGHEMPDGSFYKPVEGWLRERVKGTNRPPGMSAEEYAGEFVRRMEGGAGGKVYIGPLTGLFVWLKWWCPQIVWDWFMVKIGPEGFSQKVAAAKDATLRESRIY